MKTRNVLVSLITRDNDYQRAQAAAAESAAGRLGMDMRIVYADGDGIQQSQQLLEAIQRTSDRPDAIVFEPAGTSLTQVARAAAAAGIGWVVLNREIDSIAEIRKISRAPVFAVSSDNLEAGRIQGQQLRVLLPDGGIVLYIQGPTVNVVSQQRASGMEQSKPANVQLRILKGNWTEQSGYQALASWLRLSTSRTTAVELIASQNDAMAMGARRAIQEQTIDAERERLLKIPLTGCDGLPESGQLWVSRGLLTATIITPPLTDVAIQMLAHAFRTGSQPPENNLVTPIPFPPIEGLAPLHCS